MIINIEIVFRSSAFYKTNKSEPVVDLKWIWKTLNAAGFKAYEKWAMPFEYKPYNNDFNSSYIIITLNISPKV